MAGSLLKKITVFLLITIIIVLVGLLALPHIVDRIFLPSLLAKTPFSFSRASMSRITPYLIEGSVELKDGNNPVLSIPRFQMRFTPQSLLKRRVGSLVLDNAAFHFYRENGRLIMPQFLPQTTGKKSASQSNLFLLPLGLESLVLDQCRIIVHAPGRPSLYASVSGQLMPTFNSAQDEHRLEALNGSLFLSDDLSAAISLSATLKGDDISVQLAIDNGSLALPGEFFSEQFVPPAFKALSANLDLLLDARSFSLQRYELEGNVEDLRYVNDKIVLSSGSERNDLDFTLSGSLDTHSFQLTSIALESPVSALIDVTGEAHYREGEATSSGSASAVWLSGAGAETAKLPLSLTFNGLWSRSSGARFEIQGGYPSELPLPLSDDWVISGLETLRFASTLELNNGDQQAALELENGPFELRRDSLLLKGSGFDFKAKLSRSADKLEGKINAGLEELKLPEKNLVLKNLSLALPFSPSALTSAMSAGEISVAAVELEDEHLFSMNADITYHDSEYHTAGTIEMLNNADFNIPFSGQMAWQSRQGTLSWSLATSDLEPALLPSFLSLPADLDFSGRLEAQGGITYDKEISAWAQAAISEARLDFSDKSVSLDDLNCAIEFPELPRLQSSPSQRCSAGKIDISTLHFSDASVTFRLENPQSLFIEKSRFNWCGGTLESGSLRLSTQTSEIDTIFYCSRIGLAELLEQFGFKGTEGEGSLNGKLPIRLSRERIDFEDGFLFSTPGTGGIVRFTDTDLLRQGVGAVSEAGFLNYTLQSLEDFTYNWTKLSFDSAEDDLLLTLELDGKPSTALPFKFNNEGLLVESDQGQGLQYPIRLDVNFRVPLADLFQVGQSINSIMESGQ